MFNLIMKNRAFILAIFLIMTAVAACSGDSASHGTSSLDIEKSAPTPLNITYVSAEQGDDTFGNGDKEAPYKTITFALAAHDFKRTIELLPGLYNRDTGETFPIIIPAMKIIRGSLDDPNAVVISGSGTFNSEVTNTPRLVSLVLGDGATLSSVTVTANEAIAIWEENGVHSHPVILDSIIADSEHGIVSVNASSLTIISTAIGNNITGVELLNSSAPIFENTLITLNEVGITIQDEAAPLFNFRASGMGNTIVNNSNCDLRHFGENDISMVGVRWDDNAFEFSTDNTCSGGANIVVQGLGAIDYQFVPAESVSVFPGTRLIIITQPAFGSVIYTQEPNFTWNPISSNASMLVVMDRPPAVNSPGGDPSKIVNIDRIRWFWHPGLPSGTQGIVNFSDGRVLNSETITDTSPAIPLTKGRSYYWAVWEWNEDKTRIVASSGLNYFRIDTQ